MPSNQVQNAEQSHQDAELPNQQEHLWDGLKGTIGKSQATIQQLEKGIEVLTRLSTGDKDKDEETIQDLEGWLQGTGKCLADTERKSQEKEDEARNGSQASD